MSLTFHKVATVNEIGDGEAKHVEIGDKQIGLFRLGDAYFAIDDICSHAYALLSEGFIENDEVECPLHAGKFDIKTGKATAAPCTEDVARYEVKVEGDDVLVGV